MIVSLNIQGGPEELASVLAAIGGISLPAPVPATFQVPETVAAPADKPVKSRSGKKPDAEPAVEATASVETFTESQADDRAPAEPEQSSTEERNVPITELRQAAVAKGTSSEMREKITTLLRRFGNGGVSGVEEHRRAEALNAINAL